MSINIVIEDTNIKSLMPEVTNDFYGMTVIVCDTNLTKQRIRISFDRTNHIYENIDILQLFEKAREGYCYEREAVVKSMLDQLESLMRQKPNIPLLIDFSITLPYNINDNFMRGMSTLVHNRDCLVLIPSNRNGWDMNNNVSLTYAANLVLVVNQFEDKGFLVDVQKCRWGLRAQKLQIENGIDYKLYKLGF